MIATFYNVKHYDCSNNMNKSKLFVFIIIVRFFQLWKGRVQKASKADICSLYIIEILALLKLLTYIIEQILNIFGHNSTSYTLVGKWKVLGRIVMYYFALFWWWTFLKNYGVYLFCIMVLTVAHNQSGWLKYWLQLPLAITPPPTILGGGMACTNIPPLFEDKITLNLTCIVKKLTFLTVKLLKTQKIARSLRSLAHKCILRLDLCGFASTCILFLTSFM